MQKKMQKKTSFSFDLTNVYIKTDGLEINNIFNLCQLTNVAAHLQKKKNVNRKIDIK